ncbi:MAG TPA: hypothetical protein DDW65_23110 [Firmicutes bacterium]|nr:hypothetical protein [Bacillota bacterium]
MLGNQLLQRVRVKSSTDAGRLISDKMRDWILPYWYTRQNNPLLPTYVFGGLTFCNLSYRNWTAIRGGTAGEVLFIDRMGVLFHSRLRLSFEIWVHTGERLLTPGGFEKVFQRWTPDPGIETVSYYEHGICKTQLLPFANSVNEGIICNISLVNRSEDQLKLSAIYLVIRPWDFNGLSAIRQMEYKDNYLLINKSKVIFFEKEPQHCFFTDGIREDVTEYFQLGEGNAGLLAQDGLGTGLVGFSGLPAELNAIKLLIGDKKNFNGIRGFLAKKNLMVDVSNSLNRIRTDTAIDQLLAASLGYLRFFNHWPYCANIYQIFVFNRFSDGSWSRNCLKECLKQVTWDGLIHNGDIRPEQLLVGVADYFKLTADHHFIEKNWSTLKRIGYAIWHQKVKRILLADFGLEKHSSQDFFYERCLWYCAALRELEGLANALRETQESHNFKEQFLALWSKLTGLLEDNIKSRGIRVISLRQSCDYGAGIIYNLAGAYPLRLWEQGNSYVRDTLDFVLQKYSFQGGIYSPFEFQGIDLALSIRAGQVLIREGYDYTELLKLLFAAAGDTWSLPGRIHPLTKNGIGEYGHDPEVLYQLLLLVRSIFVIEEGSCLSLFPGIFTSNFWERPQLKISRMITYFGEISCSCSCIQDQIQIDFWPQYRIKPEKIYIRINNAFRPVYADNDWKKRASLLEMNPDFHILRLKKVKSAGLS